MVFLGKCLTGFKSDIYLKCLLLYLIFRVSAVRDASLPKNNFSEFKAKRSSFLAQIKKNTFRLEAITGNKIKFTCSIDLDGVNFYEAYNYKIIWSRESANGHDYEPLFLDDDRLVFDPRITANRFIINSKEHNQIQWNLIIEELAENDSRKYICQLNQHPYDISWLKRFILDIKVPASFIDDNEGKNFDSNNLENSYVKKVNEFDTLKIKCKAIGKPKPIVNWYLKYMNGTSLMLDVNQTEISIQNVKLSSKMNKVECRADNGYGATSSRVFKIDIKHKPYMKKTHKEYRVPIRAPELKIRCLITSYPLANIEWMFLPKNYSFKINFKLADNKLLADTQDWISLNSISSFTERDYSSFEEIGDMENNDDNFLYMLSLSKYQIYQKNYDSRYIDSSLVIKVFNENDYGSYKCVASNEFGNNTSFFKINELKNEHLDKDSVLNIIKSSKENINLKKYFGDEYYADDEYYMYANNAMNILQHSKILFVVNLFLYINVHSLIVVVF